MTFADHQTTIVGNVQARMHRSPIDGESLGVELLPGLGHVLRIITHRLIHLILVLQANIHSQLHGLLVLRSR